MICDLRFEITNRESQIANRQSEGRLQPAFHEVGTSRFNSSSQFKTTEMLTTPAELPCARRGTRKRPSTGETSNRLPVIPRGGGCQSNSFVTPPRRRVGETSTVAAIIAPLRSR